jgi:hypothetical protein
MKARHLRGFLDEFLTFRGAETSPVGENLLRVKLPKSLEPAVGRRDLVLAFNLRGIEQDPASELGTMGNPVFERILGLAREGGVAGVRYQKAPPAGKALAAAPNPAAKLRLAPGVRVEAPRAVLAPLWLLIFRAEYSLEEQADELEVVPLDGITRQVLAQTPELVDYWEALSPQPPAGWESSSPFPLPRPVALAALAVLEKRLRKRLGKIRRESEGHLQTETASIEAYYRQLIEEVRNTGRRWALAPAQRDEKIRMLQLDWKRRSDDARRSWEPQIEIAMAAAGAVMLPRICWTLSSGAAPAPVRGRRRARAPEAQVWWDPVEKQFLLPPCASCAHPPEGVLSVGEVGLSGSECHPGVESPAVRGRAAR